LIKEYLTYLKSQFLVSKEARIFGHLYESIALKEREKRCHIHWQSHRLQCKKFIKDHLHLAHKFQSVLVLGSGPLHEIPLEDLALLFERVDLVDIVHLKETKSQCSHLSNVHFIEADVTELEADLIREKKFLAKVPNHFQTRGYDLVISANLLSQLAYHLRDYLESHARPKMSEKELDHFAQQVTNNHYLSLQQYKVPVILITDIETALLDFEEKVISKESPYINFDLPTPKACWWWNIAPIPEYSKNQSVKMKVAGFLL
jgi:hypothetical protein